MSFGAHITSGEGFARIDEAVLATLVEVRVELEMDKTAKFALRFEEDICDGDLMVARNPGLQPGRRVGVFAPAGDQLVCLVYGPITQSRSASSVGGVGNWHEVHGEDRRIEMDRVQIQAAYEGRASDVATQIIGGYGFAPQVSQTERVYDASDNKLTQRGSDLKFIEQIAARNNMFFWISYQTGQPGPLGGNVSVTETAHLAPSPPRGTSALPLPPVLSPAASAATLSVSPEPPACPNVTRFEVDIDYERPNAAQGFAYDANAGQTAPQQSQPQDDPLAPDRNGVGGVDAIERSVLSSTDSDPITQRLAQEADVTEASWFVTVDCTADVAQLNRVIFPHDIVTVAHAGAQLEGPYQVTKALHVITAEAHLTDFTIRANGLRGT
jgi:hypothetical protein